MNYHPLSSIGYSDHIFILFRLQWEFSPFDNFFWSPFLMKHFDAVQNLHTTDSPLCNTRLEIQAQKHVGKPVLDTDFQTPNRREFVAGWLTRWTVNPMAKGSNPGCDRVRGRFSVPASQHLCVPVSPSCAQHALTSSRVLKILCPHFDKRRANGRWPAWKHTDNAQ